ncbi:MAG TPA: response regulator [Patescibacteria group bacterium]|nr:response regulator [Patescibacteria group bacterium]
MNKKILVVEDDQILMKALNMELLSAGFQVFSAENGAVGIEVCKKAKPDLILLDLLMPKMNGFEFLEKLKTKVPVIVLTNLSQDEDKARATKLGAIDYFIKSATNLSEITKKINKILKIK